MPKTPKEPPAPVETIGPSTLPVLPAKDVVAFPNVMMSLYVGRASSVKAVEASIKKDNLIFIVAQKNIELDDPSAKDLYKIGVVAHIVRTLQVPDGRYKVLLQGLVRAEAGKVKTGRGYMVARVNPLNIAPLEKLKAEDELIMNRIPVDLLHIEESIVFIKCFPELLEVVGWRVCFFRAD